ncbi:MAG: XRE family transcriptional regulator [Desulfobulbaceae bacterium]|nr:XRE family transcriptional regulator [Desulfobulbaceae bacterium]
MITEFGQRLHSARKMAGVSMDGLSNATGSLVSKQAISKYEKGQINPSSEVLLALAKALNVKVDYFFRTSKLNISGLAFRKKSKLSRKEEDRIRYQTLEFLQKYLELEEILNISHASNSPVYKRKIRCQEDIEQAAAETRQNWNLGEAPIQQLTELLEDNGFKILEVDANQDFVGLSGYAEGMNIPVIAVSKKSDCVRKRFTIAHELAHLLLDFSSSEESNHEKLCHAFAGALLLPEKVIREEFGGKRKKITEWELKKLKGIYGISMQAIMARALTLGLISEHTFKTFRIYVSKHGWHREEPGQYSGIEKANRFKQLVLHAAAEQIISFSKASEFLNKSLADFEKEVHIVS